MDRSGAGAVISQKYRLERKLGQGGMGEVWVARHLQLDSDVALKLLVSEQAGTAGARTRFEREAKAAAQVKSPHIVHVFDYGVDGETPYLAMELLHGEDLESRLRRDGRITIEQAITLFGPVCKALRRIHEAGLVHRDLKPSNLFLERHDHDDEDHIKILDFGIAKTTGLSRTGETTSGIVVGSPPYMSPEQILARKELDHRTDLWSLGAILYRALTGKLPFWSEVVTQLLMEICMAPAPRASQIAADLGPEVDAFFERALAKEAGDRFQTAAELGEALRGLGHRNTVSYAPVGAAKAADATDATDATDAAKSAGSPGREELASDATVPLNTAATEQVATPPGGPGGATEAEIATETQAETKTETQAETETQTQTQTARTATETETQTETQAQTHTGTEEPSPESAAVLSAVADEPRGRRRDRSMLVAVVTGAVLAALLVAAASALSPALDQAISGQAAGPVVTGGTQLTTGTRPPTTSRAADGSTAPSPTAAPSAKAAATGATAAATAGAAGAPGGDSVPPVTPGPSAQNRAPGASAGQAAAPAVSPPDDGTPGAKTGADDTMAPPPSPAPTEPAAAPSSPVTAPAGPQTATPPRREFW